MDLSRFIPIALVLEDCLELHSMHKDLKEPKKLLTPGKIHSSINKQIITILFLKYYVFLKQFFSKQTKILDFYFFFTTIFSVYSSITLLKNLRASANFSAGITLCESSRKAMDVMVFACSS